MSRLQNKRVMTFQNLVVSIKQAHRQYFVNAVKAVNVSLTMRNWVIGLYILKYEQRGADRAKYGSRILEKLAQILHKELDRCYTDRYLRLCRQFYEVYPYPQIRKSVISYSESNQIRKSLISGLRIPKYDVTRKRFSVLVPAQELFGKLSFTHFIELLRCNNPLKRARNVLCLMTNMLLLTLFFITAC